MLVDSVRITVRGGNGGKGAATLLRNGLTAFGGPDGGNGGNGGSIFFRGTTNLNDLQPFRFKKKILAEDGIAGKAKKLFGRNGKDTLIELPVGTRVTDLKTGKVLEIQDTVTEIRIVRGGKGGKGNCEFATATNRTPRYAEPGGKGEEKTLQLDLRIIAKIGLVGLPNAGKSSLLAALTNAKPAIADYPFTTLEPNIGMMGKYAIADIPGLISGAAHGKGLGIKFLKHIEKTKILVHCIDSMSADPLRDYEIVRLEFAQFNLELLEKPEVILLTKSDLVTEAHLRKITSLFKRNHPLVFVCSVLDSESLESLKNNLISLVS